MFRPPFCPNPDCTAHHGPLDRFYHRAGSFRPKCRRRPVPRFICRRCGRAFSAQTFELDYRDHRPDLNGALFARVMRGQSLRRCARELGLSRGSTLRKFHKIVRYLETLPERIAQGRVPD